MAHPHDNEPGSSPERPAVFLPLWSPSRAPPGAWRHDRRHGLEPGAFLEEDHQDRDPKLQPALTM